MKTTIRVLLACPLLLPISARAQVVNQSTGAGYGTIQAALDDASAGDVIAVDPGSYVESLRFLRSVELRAPSGATLTSDQAQVILLDGGVSLTLDGFTVSSTSDNTRAIVARDGSNILVIRNGVFDTEVTSNNDGGAIIVEDPLSVVISDTLFLGDGGDDRARNGGAIHASGTGTLTLTDVVFDQLGADDDGGAIYTDGVDLICTRCRFDGSEARGGGAIYSTGGALTVSDSLFCGSEAGAGGAIVGDAGGTIRASRFVETDATIDGGGGALHLSGGLWTLTNNHFLAAGGSGAIQGVGSARLEVVNNLFLENEGFGLNLSGGSFLDVVEHNWFEANGGLSSTGALPSSNVPFGDPRLADWAPGHCESDQLIPLALVSPLLDAGDPALLDPDGSISDIGAFGGPAADPAYHVDLDGDGASLLHDCDDDNPARFPENPEVCDEIDNDCNDRVDDAPIDIETFYPDCDGDGEGVTTGALTQCFEPDPLGCGGDWISASEGGPTAGLDCDDADPLINTSADESCAEGDQNCDGDDDFGATDGKTYFLDGDDDGYGSLLVQSCELVPPAGHVELGGDCDDGSDTTYPGAPDPCGDGVDTDCNGGDGDATTIREWYPDADHDGYGEITTTPAVGCNDPGAPGEYTGPELARDCDDTNAAVNPDAPEICNGIDDDCDGIDDDVDNLSTWYEDQDRDGYGNTAAPVESACAPDPEWIPRGGDCDDDDPAIHPEASETCNGIDDDCDSRLDAEDEDAVDVVLVWEDWDADGYGACSEGDPDCAPFAICPGDRTENHAPNTDDCNDANAGQNPSLPEIDGNAIDEDCDGKAQGSGAAAVGGSEDPGCNCATGRSSGPVPLLGLLLALTFRRRRH